jgi:transposase
LRAGDVVVWDNLKVHKNREVVEAVERVGTRIELLPPWSSDKTPIEDMFGKVKEYLRQVTARTTEAVMTVMGEALERVIPYAARTGISSSNTWNSRVKREAICCLWQVLRLARQSSMAAVKAS